MSMNAPVLPDDTGAALKTLSIITRDLIEATENVTNSIALGKDAEFYNQLKCKEKSYALYRRAADEFHAREAEFLGLGRDTLRELTELHMQLKTETHINLRFLDTYSR